LEIVSISSTSIRPEQIPSPSLTNLAHFSIQNRSDTAFPDLDNIAAMLEKSKGLKSIEISLRNKIEDFQIAKFVSSNGHNKHLTKLWLPNWEMTQHFYRKHLAVRPEGEFSCKRLERLRFDARRLPAEALLGVVELESLKVLFVKVDSAFNENRLLELLEKIDLNRTESLTLDVTRYYFDVEKHDYSRFPSLRLEKGLKFKYDGIPTRSINLSRTLDMDKLDQLTTIDLAAVSLDDYSSFHRFSHLSVLRIKLVKVFSQTKNLLTLLDIAKENNLQEVTVKDTNLFELSLILGKKLLFKAEPRTFKQASRKKILAHLGSVSLLEATILYHGSTFKDPLEEVRRLASLKVLVLGFKHLSVDSRAAVLRYGVENAMDVCEIRDLAPKPDLVSCRLEGLTSLSLEGKCLEVSDLGVLLDGMPASTLQKLTLELQERIPDRLLQYVGQLQSLKYLHLVNDHLQDVPELSNLELETLILEPRSSCSCDAFLTDDQLINGDDVDHISALPKLKYLKVGQKTWARNEASPFQIFNSGNNLRVVIIELTIEARSDVSRTEIQEAFGRSRHLKRLAKSPIYFH